MIKKFSAGIIPFLFLILSAQTVSGQNVGINNTNPFSTLDVSGSFGNNIRVVSSTATLAATDATILAGPGITVTMPASSTATRRVIRIVFNGSYGASAVTVKPAGTDHIISNNISYSSASGIPLTIGSIDLQTTGTGNWYATMNLGAQSGNDWLLTGNAGTTFSNFLGTTDHIGLTFTTNDTPRIHIDSLGRVAIGSFGIGSFDPANPEEFLLDDGVTYSTNLANFVGSINNYLQLNVHNKSSGNNASSDIVATADNGSDSTNYADFGINSSTYAPSVDNFGGPDDAYLYCYSRNLVVGTDAPGSDLIFLISGGSIKNNTAMRMVAPSRNIVIGKGEATNYPLGNVIRGPNASPSWPNIPGGDLTFQGGSATTTATGGSVNIFGGATVSGTPGSVNINTSANFPTNIGTGTTTQNVTVGGNSNNILFPKFNTIGGVFYTAAASGQIATTAAGTSGNLLQSNGAGAAPSWVSSGSLASGTSWLLLGNSGITQPAVPATYGTSTFGAAENWIGTIDAKDFTIGTSNKERMRVTSTGYVGIGTSTPNRPLVVMNNGLNNVETIENTNVAGYSSIDMYDNTGALASTFGYGNPASVSPFTARGYFNTYGNDFVWMNSAVASPVLLISSQGATPGFIGVQTLTPGQLLELGPTNRTIRINGLKSGSSFNSSSTATTSTMLYSNNSTGDVYSLPTVNNATLMTSATGVPSWKTAAANGLFWGLTGNTGTTSANFLGTTDNIGLSFRTNNIQYMHIDSLGHVGIGTTTFDATYPQKFLVDYGVTTSNNLAGFHGSINDDLSVEVKNRSNGANATSIIKVISNNGSDSTNNLEMGIHSSTYVPVAGDFGGPDDGFIYANGRHLVIGSRGTNTDLVLLTGGGTVNAGTDLRIIGSNGNVVIGAYEGTSTPIGNVLRGPNASGGGYPGGSLTIQGGAATGAGTGGTVFINGGPTASGTLGVVKINVSVNSATNINTGTSNQDVTIGGGSNDILFPKFNSIGGVFYTSAGTGIIANTGAGTSGYLLKANGAGVPPSWVDPGSLASGTGWQLSGNSGTTQPALPVTYGTSTFGASENWVGTIDAKDFTIGTSNKERMRVLSTGNVGIGTSAPGATLDVNGFNVTTGKTLNITSNSLTTGTALNVTSTGVITSTGEVAQLTGNSATTGNILTLSGTGLTTGSVLNATAGTTTGNAVSLTANGITSGTGITLTSNGLTSGKALSISSTSTAGTGSGTSYLINLARSGANTNASHTAIGINSAVTNTGTTSTNIAAQFSASGATKNYGIIVPGGGGNVGFGITAPTTTLQVNGTTSLGSASGTTGILSFLNSTNANTLNVQAGATSASYTLTLPASIGTANQTLAITGIAGSTATLGWTTPLVAGDNFQSTPANPAGTTSNTGVMAGLAASITPISSGNIMIIISGDIGNTVSNAGGAVQIRYGTGVSPLNGDALTGTTAGSRPTQVSNSATNKMPFTCNAIVTGLTIGTTYWIDLGQANYNFSGTASIKDVSISIVEL